MAIWGVVGLFLAIRLFRWEPSTGESTLPWRRSKEPEPAAS
jgi:hypothetical protein